MTYKLGIIIPYLENNETARELWNKLKKNLLKQLKGRHDTFIKVIHDNIKNPKGISYCRNKGINELIDDCEYLLFLDSDDDVSKDYIEKMIQATKTGYEMLESRFKIRDNEIPFVENVIKNHVTGIAFRKDVIGNNRFDETVMFAEDKEFVERVLDITKLRKYKVDCIYHYNYGFNNDCVCYRHSRGEL